MVALLSAGIFALGALPFFLFTPDAPRGRMPLAEAFGRGAGDLVNMVRTVRKHRDAAVYLLSRMFFVDGMVAILIYAGVYAAGVMKWDALEMLFVGIILSVLAVIGGFVAPVSSYFAVERHMGFAVPMLIATLAGSVSVLLALLVSPETKGKELVSDLVVA